MPFGINKAALDSVLAAIEYGGATLQASLLQPEIADRPRDVIVAVMMRHGHGEDVNATASRVILAMMRTLTAERVAQLRAGRTPTKDQPGDVAFRAATAALAEIKAMEKAQ